MGDLTKNFSWAEFACQCGCAMELDLRLVYALQNLRDRGSPPITITSGCRCPAHNAKVGGAQNSPHLRGNAADIVIEGLSVAEMFCCAEQSGPIRDGGMGIYPQDGFIHVDTRLDFARWCRLDGKYLPIAEGWHWIAQYGLPNSQ